MASNGYKCSKCGKILKNGIKYNSGGKVYCYDCYQEVATKIEEEQSKKTEIYEYIKKIFKTKSLTDYLVDGITRLLKEGKTEDGILYTLYYIYEIKEIDRELEYIIPNIKRYYQDAKDYHDLQLKVEAVNEEAQVEAKPVVIQIKKSDLDEASKPKFSYNIEDL